MNRRELYNFAIAQEQRSQKLYQGLAKSFGEPETNSFFTELVNLEKEHELKLRNAFSQEFPGEDPQPESQEIKEIPSVDLKDPAQLLQFAITREEEAAKSYYSFAENTAQPDIRGLLLHLAKEEEQHKTLLLTEMQRILGALEWFDPSELDGFMDF
ncbi:MAG: ferritin family protein [Candidatus Cloacimonadaceae bacterium]|jgi:rubrerythrin|nr:ferritin family protein [Candidatus Cloacimonadota bacterium]MCB5257632.1 ferritin family protein [Candidatus Cloacimonadota bacterium]MDD5625257.1 ferritin family protein [Candidatus Cloacimonadota bacterium]MDY0111932.1 ferritin family protein [Candidatus Syntrophosphaera sp.]